MDANVKIVIDQYFDGAADLKPNLFIPVRDNHVLEEALVTAYFSETEPSTLIASDDQEIFAGDILVYPKTRQFCCVDDIRHIPGKKIFIVHYHTKYQRMTHSFFGDD